MKGSPIVDDGTGRLTRTCMRCDRVCHIPSEISSYSQALYCRECKLARARERAAERYARDPEGVRAYNRGWKERNRDKQREYERRAYRKAVRSKRGRADQREKQRMWRRLKRERDGNPLPPVPMEQWVKSYGADNTGRLPVEPLVSILRQQKLSTTELEHKTGVPARRFYGLMIGESQHVSVSVADRICLGLDLPLAVVYPEIS